MAEFFRGSPPELELLLISGGDAGKQRRIDRSAVERLGTAFWDCEYPEHESIVGLLGAEEISYIDQIPAEDATRIFRDLPIDQISCFIVADELDPPKLLLELARQHEIAIFKTRVEASLAISLVTGFLERKSEQETTIHGVFVRIHDHGLLLRGESGIGKSECALELIRRGHRLIADDAVVVNRIGNELIASAPELLQDHIEIRGLGIFNVREVFGPAAVGESGKIDLCINLKSPEEAGAEERLEPSSVKVNILGCDLPGIDLPVGPGRNIATVVETAVRIFSLNSSFGDGARELIRKHGSAVSRHS
ncbi:MAG: HPr(Ser) kinase/phosphatase [Acidobacteria bacterium]|nr:HPr(Ser) kinase/phosphatase [Acidobacteriota bacterium]